MIHFLHGENTGASRQRFLELKKSFSLGASEASLAEGSPLGSVPLFGPTPARAWEVFKKDELKACDTERFTKELQSFPAETTLIFWFGFELPPGHVLAKAFKALRAKEEKISIPLKVFKVAEAFFAGADFYPKFVGFSLSSGGVGTKGEEIFLLQMTIRQNRLLLGRALGTSSFKVLSPFQKNLLSGTLSKEALQQSFKELVALEKDYKSVGADLASRLLMIYEKLHRHE